MPTTPSQLKANAQHSTGPKTFHGKLMASRNATTHGLNTRRSPLGPEAKQFKRLADSVVAQYQPQNPVEAGVCQQIALALWKQQKLVALDLASSRAEELHFQLTQVNPADYAAPFPYKEFGWDTQKQPRLYWLKRELVRLEVFLTNAAVALTAFPEVPDDIAEDDGYDSWSEWVSSLAGGISNARPPWLDPTRRENPRVVLEPGSFWQALDAYEFVDDDDIDAEEALRQLKKLHRVAKAYLPSLRRRIGEIEQLQEELAETKRILTALPPNWETLAKYGRTISSELKRALDLLRQLRGGQLLPKPLPQNENVIDV